jgi:uncharacterized membrane protein
MASLAGAGFIAVVASPWVGLQIIIYISIFGFLVSLIDSILGAWVQLQLKCPDCGKIVETKQHCNKCTDRISQWIGIYTQQPGQYSQYGSRCHHF